jgi:CheY-like chemotaxis protein
MPKKILAVDDSMMIREMLKGLLIAGGFEVVTAENGKTGVEAAKKHHPDLILMDIIMPVLDGFAAAKMMRNIKEIKDTPIIFLSARDDIKNKKAAFELGGDDYIVKPFDYEELMVRVNRWIDQKSKNEKSIKKAQGDTLTSLMVTIAHYINNSLASMIGFREIMDPDNKESIDRFLQTFDTQVDVIQMVVQSLKEMANKGDVAVTDYITAKSTMLDISIRLKEKTTKIEE